MDTKQLFEELKTKLILDLQEGEIACPTCSGLRMNLVERDEKHFIEQCRDCHTGKLFVCEYCGKHNKSSCDCVGYRQEIMNKNYTKEIEKINKATVVKF